MPLEIRELHIKAVITDEQKPEHNGSGTGQQEQTIDDIVRACVDQVLKILREKAER